MSPSFLVFWCGDFYWSSNVTKKYWKIDWSSISKNLSTIFFSQPFGPKRWNFAKKNSRQKLLNPLLFLVKVHCVATETLVTNKIYGDWICWQPKLWQWKNCDNWKKRPLKMSKTKTLMTKTFVIIENGDNWKRWQPKTLDCGDQMPFQSA
jgi:hypothetical protein